MVKDNQPISFGPYTLYTLLHSATLSEVYLARPADPESPGIYVLKKLRPEYSDNEGLRALFTTRAKISAALEHPNIVAIHDFGVVESDPYIAAELVQGITLGHLTQKLQTTGVEFSPEFVGFVVNQLFDGLEFAHSKRSPVSDSDGRIIHGNLTSHSVLVSFDGGIKIGNFSGLPFDQLKALRNKPLLLNTLPYMPPEMITGGAPSWQWDVYSLGVLAYELLRGAPPFSASSPTVLISDIAELAPEPLNDGAVSVAVMKALEKDPNDRYASLDDFKTALIDAGMRLSGETPLREKFVALLSNLFGEEKRAMADQIEGAKDAGELIEDDEKSPADEVSREKNPPADEVSGDHDENVGEGDEDDQGDDAIALEGLEDENIQGDDFHNEETIEADQNVVAPESDNATDEMALEVDHPEGTESIGEALPEDGGDLPNEDTELTEDAREATEEAPDESGEEPDGVGDALDEILDEIGGPLEKPDETVVEENDDVDGEIRASDKSVDQLQESGGGDKSDEAAADDGALDGDTDAPSDGESTEDLTTDNESDEGDVAVAEETGVDLSDDEVQGEGADDSPESSNNVADDKAPSEGEEGQDDEVIESPTDDELARESQEEGGEGTLEESSASEDESKDISEESEGSDADDEDDDDEAPKTGKIKQLLSNPNTTQKISRVLIIAMTSMIVFAIVFAVVFYYAFIRFSPVSFSGLRTINVGVVFVHPKQVKMPDLGMDMETVSKIESLYQSKRRAAALEGAPPSRDKGSDRLEGQSKNRPEIQEHEYKPYMLKGFKGVEDFFRHEYTRYTGRRGRLVKISYLGTIRLRRTLPIEDGYLSKYKATEKFQLMTYAQNIDTSMSDILIFVYLHHSKRVTYTYRTRSFHRYPVGLIVNRFKFGQPLLRWRDLAYEIALQMGASVKWDDEQIGEFPYGYGDPYALPLFPQGKAELMALNVLVGKAKSREPKSLREVRVGPKTAYEFKWIPKWLVKEYYEDVSQRAPE